MEEWEHSGLSAAAFAKRRCLRKDTLVWWRWRLGRSKHPPASVKLVPVEIEPEADRQAVNAEVAWELAGPSGHVLRVYERGVVHVLREALDVVASGKSKRR